MTVADLTADAVKLAMQQFDELSNDVFVSRRGFRPSRRWVLEDAGRRYDVRALIAEAHGHIGGGYARLRTSHFSLGETYAKGVLETLGFRVVPVGGAAVLPRQRPWSRNELLLILDVYVRRSLPPNGEAEDVTRLREVLGRLYETLNPASAIDLRSSADVFEVLRQISALDEGEAEPPLADVSPELREAWAQFRQDRGRLHRMAATILAALEAPPQDTPPVDDQEFVEAPEGAVFTCLHRNRALAATAKSRALQRHGRLAREACGFDFGQTYGSCGAGFIEAHHIRSVSSLEVGATTKIEDLALLCADCHRMIHSVRPWLTVAELQTLLAGNGTVPDPLALTQ